MVCTGNICRSPLAEGIMRARLEAVDAAIAQVDSAGTHHYHVGEAPDERSVAVARQHGIDISKQRARAFRVEDFDEFDYIYIMDSSHYQTLQRLAREHKKEHLFHQKVDFLTSAAFPAQNRAVPDPYYGDKSGFQDCYALIDLACKAIIEKVYKLSL